MMNKTPLSPGIFSIDDLISVVGWTAGDHWNGWECPCFEKIEAEYILKKLYTPGGENVDPKSWWKYDEKADIFSALDGYNVTEEMTEAERAEWVETWDGFDVDTPSGIRHVYAIGSHAWVWSKED